MEILLCQTKSLLRLKILVQCTLARTHSLTHTQIREDGPSSPRGLSQAGCQMLQTAAVITDLMNTLPFMFIQTLIYLPQKIKEDTQNFQKSTKICGQNDCNSLSWVGSHSVCVQMFVAAFFYSRDGLWNIKVCYMPPWNWNIKDPPPTAPTRTPECCSFFPPVQLRLFPISALLKKQSL